MAQAIAPRPLPSVLLFSLVPIGAWLLIRPLLDPLPPIPAFLAAAGFSIFAFLSIIYLVPVLGPAFVKARLSGRDLLKTYDTPMCVRFYVAIGSVVLTFELDLKVLVWSAHPSTFFSSFSSSPSRFLMFLSTIMRTVRVTD